MKPDTERKKYYSEKLHKRKKRVRAHLSKDLRAKLKSKKRSLQVRKGDVVKVLRGSQKGKEAKVSKVSTLKRKVYLEGVTVTNSRSRDVFVPFEPSNVLLVGLEPTPERKKVFAEDAFKKAKPKAEEKKTEKPAEKAETKTEKKIEKAEKPVEKAEQKEAPKEPAKKPEPKEAPKEDVKR